MSFMKDFFGRIFFPVNIRSARGFIGAIGDDLPSLIPIVFALLLFFTVFSATLSNYETKNAVFNEQVKMISVSRELKGDSLILDLNQFSQNCDAVRSERIPYNFMAGIYLVESAPFGTGLSNMIDCVSPEGQGFNERALLSDPYKEGCSTESESLDCKYFCEYIRVGSKGFDCSQKNYVIKFYPVAVQTKLVGEHSVIAPAIMAMVVWE